MPSISLKTYQRIKLAVVFVTAFIFSQSIVLDTYALPLAVLAVAPLFLLYLRSKVTEIVADERDYATAGRAALWAMQIFSWIGVVTMIILYAKRGLNPFYEPIAMTLAFAVIVLMLLYAVIFHYLNHFTFSDRRMLFTAFVLVLFLAAAIFGLKLFSGEDNWICQSGEWVAHGHPSFPAPNVPCE